MLPFIVIPVIFIIASIVILVLPVIDYLFFKSKYSESHQQQVAEAQRYGYWIFNTQEISTIQKLGIERAAEKLKLPPELVVKSLAAIRQGIYKPFDPDDYDYLGNKRRTI